MHKGERDNILRQLGETTQQLKEETMRANATAHAQRLHRTAVEEEAEAFRQMRLREQSQYDLASQDLQAAKNAAAEEATFRKNSREQDLREIHMEEERQRLNKEEDDIEYEQFEVYADEEYARLVEWRKRLNEREAALRGGVSTASSSSGPNPKALADKEQRPDRRPLALGDRKPIPANLKLPASAKGRILALEDRESTTIPFSKSDVGAMATGVAGAGIAVAASMGIGSAAVVAPVILATGAVAGAAAGVNWVYQSWGKWKAEKRAKLIEQIQARGITLPPNWNAYRRPGYLTVPDLQGIILSMPNAVEEAN
jgi:hypothetical protein